MELERENLITGAEAYAKHAVGLDTLEEKVHKTLNETETKILDATGLTPVLEKYNEVKSEIDQYSNAAHDAAVSTTVPHLLLPQMQQPLRLRRCPWLPRRR